MDRRTCRHWNAKASVSTQLRQKERKQRRRKTTIIQTNSKAGIVFYAFRPDLAKNRHNSIFLSLRSFCRFEVQYILSNFFLWITWSRKKGWMGLWIFLYPFTAFIINSKSIYFATGKQSCYNLLINKWLSKSRDLLSMKKLTHCQKSYTLISVVDNQPFFPSFTF